MQDGTTINRVPLGMVLYLDFDHCFFFFFFFIICMDTSIEIGAFFFTLPFPLFNYFETSDAAARSTREL